MDAHCLIQDGKELTKEDVGKGGDVVVVGVLLGRGGNKEEGSLPQP